MRYPKPHITEKSLKISENNWYSFRTDKSTTKNDIAIFIKEKYSLKPISIKSEIFKPIIKKRNKRTFKTHCYKIFRVKMPKEAKIPGFEVTK